MKDRSLGHGALGDLVNDRQPLCLSGPPFTDLDSGRLSSCLIPPCGSTWAFLAASIGSIVGGLTGSTPVIVQVRWQAAVFPIDSTTGLGVFIVPCAPF